MAWYPALKVFVAFVVTFFVAPRILFPAPKVANGRIDRVLIDILRMSALTVALVHVLVPLQLFQTAGLALFAVTWIYFVRLRPIGWDVNRFYEWASLRVRAWLYLVEAGSKEGNLRVKEVVAKWLRTAVRPRLTPKLPSRRTSIAIVLALPLTAVLVGSLWVRIAYPLRHAAFAASDGYVHLAWLKYIYAGELFRDGIYPHGMHALLGLAAKLAPVTNFHMVRFAGPFINTLFVFVAYWLIVRATRHVGLGLVAAAAIGLAGMRPELGLHDYRQVGTLPQEVAVLIAALGLVQAVEYAIRPQRSRLIYIAMAAVVVAMTHPLAMGIVLVAAGACGVVAAIRTGSIRPVLPAVGVAVVATVAGQMYVVLGKVLGAGVYGAVNTNPLAKAVGAARVPPLATLPVAELAIAGGALAVVWSILRVRRSPSHAGAMALGLAVAGCALAQILAKNLLGGWYAERWGEVVKPLLPIGIALLAAPAATALARLPVERLWERIASARLPRSDRVLARASVAVSAGSLATVALIGAMPPLVGQPRFNSEYESSARVLGSQMRANERYSYTVVGPPSWYVRVLGSGYHVHLTDFADRLDMADAIDPGFDIPIATEKVLIMTEKRPFHFNYFGTVKGGVERYFDAKARGKIMRDVERWMRAYAEHHDGVEIAYEDEDIRLWRVKHPANYEYTRRYGLTPPAEMPQPDTNLALGGS